MLLQVMQGKLLGKTNTTIDENGKFSYFSADMRPVPPGRCNTEICEAYEVGFDFVFLRNNHNHNRNHNPHPNLAASHTT